MSVSIREFNELLRGLEHVDIFEAVFSHDLDLHAIGRKYSLLLRHRKTPEDFALHAENLEWCSRLRSNLKDAVFALIGE